MILYKKLLDIDRKGTMSKVMTPVYKLKKKNKQIYIKNGIKTLAQENLFILKRILEKKGNIDNQKLKKDFQKSQEYKNNICNFPSINANRIKKVNEKINQNLHSTNNKTLPSIINGINNKLNKCYYKDVLLKKNTNFIKKTKKIEKEKKLEEKDIMSDNGNGGSGDSENEGSVISENK